MAHDIFAKFEGIDGESTDSKHSKEIEVLSVSFNVVQPISGTVSSSGSLSSARAEFSEVSIAKLYDIASAKLFEHCATGQHIPSVTLSFHRAAGDKAQYLEIKLTDVLVSGYSVGGSTGGEVPTEQVSLIYGKIEKKYTKYDTKGASSGNASAAWDRIKNEKA